MPTIKGIQLDPQNYEMFLSELVEEFGDAASILATTSPRRPIAEGRAMDNYNLAHAKLENAIKFLCQQAE